MIILAHRGLWHAEAEQNSAAAIKRALDAGFGVETDLRDRGGSIVVSHDPPRGGEMSFESLLSIADLHPGPALLALNVKADGLQPLMESALRARHDYFLFDMSVPDMVVSIRRGLTCFTRKSDVEPEPVLLDDVEGVWLDSFASSTADVDAAAALVARGKKVAFVSPELHGRPHQAYWTRLLESGLHLSSDSMLCTDLPDRAARFFGGRP
jgi:glycerophosphoryl diester phosphodiesterase